MTLNDAVGNSCVRRALAATHLAPLQLKEVVEIIGVERRGGQVRRRRRGSLVEGAEVRVRGVRFGSEGVEGAGLVGVLQGEVDPVEELRGLVHGGTRVYGRQQAHLSIQMAQLDFSTADSWAALNFCLPFLCFYVSFVSFLSFFGRCRQTASAPLLLLFPVKVPVLLTPGSSTLCSLTRDSLR